MSPIRDEDIALAAAFVDGELREPERTRFELRLSAEPDLAAHVEGLMRTDEFVRRHTRAKAVAAAPRPRFRLLPALALAAAAILAILAVRSLLGGGRDRPRALEVALVPGCESAAEWIAREPGFAGRRPPGLDELRGANEEPNVDARTFVEAAERAEARAFGASTPAETTAAFFTLPMRASETSLVFVFGFPTRGTPLRYFPPAGETRADAALVEPGDHVLPGASFRLVADPRGDRVEYQRGFLVPIGAERMEIVVAARPARGAMLDPSALEPAADAATTAERLRAADFDVRTFVVREP